MKQCILLAGVWISVFAPFQSIAGNVLESFTITTENVTIRESTETSLQLRSDSNSYFIKLEPNREGRVIFGLSGIGYTTTARVSNLTFGVRITGYRNHLTVYPSFSVDDINRDIAIEGNTIKFHQIYGSLPVWFDTPVDSVNLEFFNSMEINVNQYLGIQDLRLVPPTEIAVNPVLVPCRENTVMIGIDGSSSIDKRERNAIAAQLKGLVKKSSAVPDTHALCIMEFGTHVMDVVETEEKGVLKKAIKRYKKDKNHEGDCTSYTNWSAAFDEAITRKPDVFVFITDGWSNWIDHGPASLTAQFENLLSKSNTLKANGTRLLFITSDMDLHQHAKTNLYHFLNGDRTRELNERYVTQEVSLEDIDLITMRRFSKMEEINFQSMFICPDEVADASQE